MNFSSFVFRVTYASSHHNASRKHKATIPRIIKIVEKRHKCDFIFVFIVSSLLNTAAIFMYQSIKVLCYFYDVFILIRDFFIVTL